MIHRVVAQAFVPNPRPDLFTIVDHINRDPGDNRACNLRWVDHQLNQMNKDGSSVFFRKDGRLKPWISQVKGMSQKTCATREEAVAHSKKMKELRFERAYQEKLNAPPKAPKFKSIGVQTEPVQFK